MSLTQRRPLALIGALALLLAVLLPATIAAAETGPTYLGEPVQNDTKIWVCKYVGPPQGEVLLKGGKNPINPNWSSVSSNLPDGFTGELVGQEWTEAQGQRSLRSVIVAPDDDCLGNDVEPEPSEFTLTDGCVAEDGFIQVVARAYDVATAFELSASNDDDTLTTTGTADEDDGAATLRLDGLDDGTWAVSFTADGEEQLAEGQRTVTIDCDLPPPPSNGPDLVSSSVTVVKVWEVDGEVLEGDEVPVLDGVPVFDVTLGAASQVLNGAGTATFPGLVAGSYDVSVSERVESLPDAEVLFGDGCSFTGVEVVPASTSVQAPGSVTVTVTNSYECEPEISVLPTPPLEQPTVDPEPEPEDPEPQVEEAVVMGVSETRLPDTGAPAVLLALVGLLSLGLGGGLLARRRG